MQITVAQQDIAAALRAGKSGKDTAARSSADVALTSLRQRQRIVLALLQPRMDALNSKLAPVAELLKLASKEASILSAIEREKAALGLGGGRGTGSSAVEAEQDKDKNA